MPKAGNESLDFCWLNNKTWSVEEHSAFQTLKFNPSKLSILKNTHQVHPTIFSVGFSAFWRVPHIGFFKHCSEKSWGELTKTTISIWGSKSTFRMKSLFVCLEHLCFWLQLKKPITGFVWYPKSLPKKNPLKNSISISWIYPRNPGFQWHMKV